MVLQPATARAAKAMMRTENRGRYSTGAFRERASLCHGDGEIVAAQQPDGDLVRLVQRARCRRVRSDVARDRHQCATGGEWMVKPERIELAHTRFQRLIAV